MNRRPGASPLIAPESRVPRRQAAGRHTSLIDDTADLPAPVTQSARVRSRGEAGRDAWPRERSTGAYQPGSTSDTVILGDLGDLGDLGLFGGPSPRDGSPGSWPRIGVNREPPPRSWHQNRTRLIIATAGLAVVAVAGFLGVPALLHTLGVGAGAQSGLCPLCQLPVPSSAPVPAGAMAAPASPAAPATKPRQKVTTPARATAAAAPPAAPAPPARATPASRATSSLVVTYSVLPGSGGQFDGQVTIGNQGTSAISNWQLIVALPADTVSAVQNAEFSDNNDVLFLSPAPDDLSIAPDTTVTVSIFASGSTTYPAECSFNGVACRLDLAAVVQRGQDRRLH